jgi:hypothetical protein
MFVGLARAFMAGSVVFLTMLLRRSMRMCSQILQLRGPLVILVV